MEAYFHKSFSIRLCFIIELFFHLTLSRNPILSKSSNSHHYMLLSRVLSKYFYEQPFQNMTTFCNWMLIELVEVFYSVQLIYVHISL